MGIIGSMGLIGGWCDGGVIGIIGDGHNRLNRPNRRGGDGGWCDGGLL